MSFLWEMAFTYRKMVFTPHVLEVPKTTLSFGDSLKRLTEIGSFFYTSVYGSLRERIQIKISEGKRHMVGWCPGESSHKLSGIFFHWTDSMPLIIPVIMCGNISKAFPTRKTHLRLVAQGFCWCQSYRHTTSQLLRLQTLREKQTFTINHIISINFLIKLVQHGPKSQA